MSLEIQRKKYQQDVVSNVTLKFYRLRDQVNGYQYQEEEFDKQTREELTQKIKIKELTMSADQYFMFDCFFQW